MQYSGIGRTTADDAAGDSRRDTRDGRLAMLCCAIWGYWLSGRSETVCLTGVANGRTLGRHRDRDVVVFAGGVRELLLEQSSIWSTSSCYVSDIPQLNRSGNALPLRR